MIRNYAHRGRSQGLLLEIWTRRELNCFPQRSGRVIEGINRATTENNAWRITHARDSASVCVLMYVSSRVRDILIVHCT